MGKYTMVLAAALGGVLAGATPADAATVKMKRTATVGGSLIRLRDVAEVRGTDTVLTARLAEAVLAPTPSPGKQTPLSVHQIQKRLERLGISLAEVSFSGASRVIVHPGPATASARSGHADAQPAPRQAGRPAQVTEAQLKRLIEDFVVQRLARSREQTCIEIDSTRALKELGGGQWSLQVTCRPGRRLLGKSNVEVIAYDRGRPVLRVNVPLQVSILEQVVVASRALRRGSRVGAADVKLKQVRLQGTGQGVYKRTADVVGQQITHDLPTDQVVSLRDVKGVPLVKRGDRIELTVTVGGVQVRTEAIAVSDGVHGSTIEVRRLNSRDVITATVAGSGKAVIEAPSRVRAVAVVPRSNPRPVRTASRSEARP